MVNRLLLLGLWLGVVLGQDSLQAVDDVELAKLAQEEKFVVALLCTEENAERSACVLYLKKTQQIVPANTNSKNRLLSKFKYHLRRIIRCEEFEGELASIREDVIDSLEDGWVVKSVC